MQFPNMKTNAVQIKKEDTKRANIITDPPIRIRVRDNIDKVFKTVWVSALLANRIGVDVGPLDGTVLLAQQEQQQQHQQ